MQNGDVSIQWNATYHIVVRAPCLQHDIDDGTLTDNKSEFAYLALSSIEWAYLRYLVTVLWPYCR
jgi:hypothetical protein